MQTPEDFADNLIEIFNTKIPKFDQNALKFTLNCSRSNNTVTPDHEDFADCPCG